MGGEVPMSSPADGEKEQQPGGLRHVNIDAPLPGTRVQVGGGVVAAAAGEVARSVSRTTKRRDDRRLVPERQCERDATCRCQEATQISLFWRRA